MKNTWEFLDKMDYNLLYSYSEVLSNKMQQIHLCSSGKSDNEEFEIALANRAKKNRAYYLIWVVFRYVLECDTYDKALMYATDDVLKRYKLISYLTNKNIYIGADYDTKTVNGVTYKFPKVWFRSTEDIDIVLDILYHRLDFFEQFQCCISHSKKVSKAMKAINYYKNPIAVQEQNNN